MSFATNLRFEFVGFLAGVCQRRRVHLRFSVMEVLWRPKGSARGNLDMSVREI